MRTRTCFTQQLAHYVGFLPVRTAALRHTVACLVRRMMTNGSLVAVIAMPDYTSG
jgi:hypothetical protein